MANGFFDPSFRGAGSPGAPGVGTTQRGLQLVEQGKNVLATQQLGLERAQAAQPGLLAADAQAVELSAARQPGLVAGAGFETLGARDKARTSSLVQGALQLKRVPQAQKLEALIARKTELQGAGLPTGDTDEAITLAEAGDFEGLEKATDSAIALGERFGLISGGAQNVSAEQRGFERLIEDFTPEEQVQARKTRAGIIAKAGDSSAERIARDEELSDQVAEVEAKKAEQRALGKIKGEAKGAPLVAKAKSEIATAVKLATAEAAARGEALSDLKKAEAGLPGLEEVVGKLRELSTIATFTLTGKAFNLIAKELGFGATKGGTARAAYQATIDNQVLPLLKQTFGAAMTEGEGKRLAATLGDVDAPPEEKQAQLDAFLGSQKRQIENLKREVAPADFTSSSGITFTVN